MKKRKLFIRVIAAILIAVIVAGVIVPVVSATEIDLPDETTEEITDVNYAKELPEGFKYVDDGDNLIIQKEDGNATPAMIIEGLPENFNRNSMIVFIGNIETHEVTYANLLESDSYLSPIYLSEGYYIVYANGYAWDDANGNSYTINNGSYVYWYIGSDYNAEKYNVEFQTGNDILRLQLTSAPDSFQKIPYDEFLHSFSLEYPEDAMLKDSQASETTPSTSTPQQEPVEKKERTFWDLLLSSIKDSAILLILLGGCSVALWVVKLKKKAAAEKQAENDRYDDRHID